MSTLPLPSVVLAGALVLGVIGNALLRAPGAPALNLFVWSAAVAAATVLLHRRSGRGLSTEATAALALGVVYAAGLVWRDSPALKLTALGGTAVCFAVPAFRAGAAWLRSSRVLGYVAALATTGLYTAFGGALVVLDASRVAPRRDPSRQTQWTHAVGVARGLALAVPLVVVFGGLFMSADAVFAGIVTDVVRVDLDTVASHIVLTAFLSWIAAGYLRGSLTTSGVPAVLAERRAGLTITELGTAMALIGLLFLAFVLVQFRYLFGGSELVHVTPGLTYAEYARRGFFELVAVVALMLPLLLAADWLLRRHRRSDEAVFRGFALVQIVLVLVVLASALQRMRLYQLTYGLTELRFYVTATLILLGLVLLWFTATVLRGRRELFAFGTLIVTLSAGAALHAVNPDAVIARTNIARAHAGGGGVPRFDVVYATSLSADAVPVLLDALPGLPPDARCRSAQRLLERWDPGARAPLRTWNWSESRARRAVSEQQHRLRELACR